MGDFEAGRANVLGAETTVLYEQFAHFGALLFKLVSLRSLDFESNFSCHDGMLVFSQ